MGSENNMVAVPRFWMRLLEATEVLVKRTETEAGFYREWSAAEHAAKAARERLARLASPQPDAQQGEGRTLQLDEGGQAAPPHCDWAEVMPDGSERYLFAVTGSAITSSPALDAATIERCAELVDGYATAHQGQALRDLIWGIAGAIRALPNAEKRHG